MKYIFLLLIFMLELFGATIKSPIITLSDTEVTIKIEKADIGMSGFVVHKIDDKHKTIVKNVVVTAFDAQSSIATLKLSEYSAFGSDTLPSSQWSVEVGDSVVLAFGYKRGLLIAPSEEIYYRVVKNSEVEWVHPDMFATALSFAGHPTPLREDFTNISQSSSIGLVYIFLEDTLYTLDAKSFAILSTIEASLDQTEVVLPFYTRLPEIDANWWGEGSSELEEYGPHYYELIAKANPTNTELYKKIKNGGEKLQYILDEFNIQE